MLMPTYVSRAVPKASDEESQSDRGCDCSCNNTFHGHVVICFVDSRFELHPYNGRDRTPDVAILLVVCVDLTFSSLYV